MQYYYLDSKKRQRGPLEREALLKVKGFGPASWVWAEGMASWQPAGEAEGLRDAFPPAPELPPGGPPPPPVAAGPVRRRWWVWGALGLLGLAALLGGYGAWANWRAERDYLLDQERQRQEFQARQLAQDQAQLRAQADAQAAAQQQAQEAVAHFRANWPSQVLAQVGQYSYNPSLGGVSAFDLGVVNRSEFWLDEVHIQVLHYKKGGGIYQRKTYTVRDLARGATARLRIAGEPRGVEVSAMVSGVVSRSAGLSARP